MVIGDVLQRIGYTLDQVVLFNDSHVMDSRLTRMRMATGLVGTVTKTA
jgi:hypothetical protein